MKRILVLLIPVLMTSCAYLPSSAHISSRDKAYLSARSIPPLRIPPGVASSALVNSHPVSDRAYPLSQEDISVVPPGLMDK